MIVDDLPIKRRTSLTPPPDNQGGRLRLLILGVGMLFAFTALSLRLFDLQINYRQSFEAAARRNSIETKRLPAPRGLIYDRNGEPLVRNAPAFEIAVVPARLPRTPDRIEQRVLRMNLYNRLAAMINQPGVTAGDIFTKVQVATFQAPYAPLVIAENVPRDLALTIQEQSLTMPGVVVQAASSRTYPHNELLGNIMGYVAKIPAEWVDEYDPGIYAVTDRVGVAGIEFAAEQDLVGIKGTEQVLVDASGEELSLVGPPLPPKEGNSVRLTLDLRLQKIISDALIPAMQVVGSPRGAVVALNPNTGEVLGMVTIPGYDNNLFTQGITQEQLDALLKNDHRPLLNHATSDQVPPGSTFKIVTAAALLEERAVTEGTVVNDPGIFLIPDQYFPDDPDKGQQFYCWKRTGHGNQTIRDALRNSCDTYFYKTVGGYKAEGLNGMGPDLLAKWAATFGIGEETKLEIGGSRGFAPTPAWKRNTFGEVWTTGDSYNMSIGQGYMLATPLEMANITAAIANGGTLYQPQLIREVVEPNGKIVKPFIPKVIRQLPLSPQWVRLIQESMVEVVSDRGTAIMSQIPGYQYAGKTGTSEFCDDVALKTNICYPGIKILPTHAWFVAYAPAENPQLALAVYVWNGGQGSGTAAPIAQRIIANYFEFPLPNPTPIEKTTSE